MTKGTDKVVSVGLSSIDKAKGSHSNSLSRGQLGAGFELLHSRTFDAVMVIDMSLRLVFVNDAACRILGYSRDELLGVFVEAIHPASVGLIEAVLDGSRGRAGEWSETQLLARSGRSIDVEASAVLFEVDGEKFLMGCFRDVTVRKRAERKLRESEEKYRCMAEAMTDAVYICSPVFKVTYMNEAMVRRVGREAIGESCFKVINGLAERCPWCVHERVQRGEIVHTEIVSPKDGLYYQVSNSPIFHSDGSISKMTIYRDITQEKRAYETLRKALSEVKELKDQLEADFTYVHDEIKMEYRVENIVGKSDAIRNVLSKVKQVSPTDATVLILGETGTGKELIARAIHDFSARKNRPLVKVNCAALPSTLIESELFGHEKGAFTGAHTRQQGRFEIADQSTIFLDEIGELPLELQAKLLRVIEDGEFERLGSHRTIKVNARIMVATNRDLEKECREGRFRTDLYYRLNVFPIIAPPLRERKDDIPIIVKVLIDRLNKKLGKKIQRIPKDVLETLIQYPWPGNVRELKNIIERAVINSNGPHLQLADPIAARRTRSLIEKQGTTLEDVERAHIEQILAETRWQISGPRGAALILGLNPSTLRSRIAKLGVKKPA